MLECLISVSARFSFSVNYRPAFNKQKKVSAAMLIKNVFVVHIDGESLFTGALTALVASLFT